MGNGPDLTVTFDGVDGNRYVITVKGPWNNVKLAMIGNIVGAAMEQSGTFPSALKRGVISPIDFAIHGVKKDVSLEVFPIREKTDDERIEDFRKDLDEKTRRLLG